MEAETRSENSGLPGKIQSIWMATAPGDAFPVLPGDISVDVVVIGGGISGITTAYLLKEEGLRVAVIDSGRIAGGVSGHTAGKITSQHQLIYHHLITNVGMEKAQQYADANQAAIEKIASLVRERDITCDFTRRDAYTYALNGEERALVEAELTAAERLKLPASFAEHVPLPIDTNGAIRFSHQAQFHPRKYVLALANTIPGKGSHVFEKTGALDIQKGDQCVVTTTSGRIAAKSVVIATNLPFYDPIGLYRPRLSTWRAYMLGIVTREPFPAGMYIGVDDTTGHSFRSQPLDNGEVVLLGGEDHEARGGDPGPRYGQLADFARRIYPSAVIKFRWAGAYYNTPDRIPYIGNYTPGRRDLFIATGFGGWGLTTGTVAGLILRDRILGRPNPWAPVFDPARLRS